MVITTSSSLSLVQFDLGQIFNSSSVSDTSDMYLVLPITVVAACRTNSADITTALLVVLIYVQSKLTLST